MSEAEQSSTITPEDFKDSIWQPVLDEASGCYYFTCAMTQETTWLNPHDADFKTRRAEEKANTAAYYQSTIKDMPSTSVKEDAAVAVGDGSTLIL
jgi:penicillin V acylase-like amidase (Ntn superfamily)